MAWNPPAPPEPPEPSVCDEMRGDCANCPERLECSMPDPPELDPDNMDDWGMMADSDQVQVLPEGVAIG